MANFGNFSDFVNESTKITLKRKYTENHPAVTVGKFAKVRNKMLEAIADGTITQEEFEAILKEMTADGKRWMTRNSRYFNVSEEGISLSVFGKRALSSIGVNESKFLTLNEGQFSWMTLDTGRQIGSERENTITVYMFDNQGNSWREKRYEGYGEFGGKDYYELLDQMNGGEGDRQAGIDLAFNDKLVKAGEVLFPALVEDPRFNWKRHDFTQEADHDPNQSWYDGGEDDYDDYDDYDESNEVEEGRAFVAAAKKAKDAGEKEFEFDGEKFPVTLKEGRAFVAAAKKAKDAGDKEFEFDGKKYPVTLKENKGKSFIYESFEAFVNEGSEEKIAQSILDDLLGEWDPWELADMLPDDARETVSTYGYKGSKAEKIATALLSMAQNGEFESVSVNENKYAAKGKLGYNDQFLDRKKSLAKTISTELGLTKEFVGPWVGFDYIDMYVIGDGIGGTVLSGALDGSHTYDDLKAAAAEYLKGKNVKIKESVELNEAFKSAKLASILTGAKSMPKDLPKAFYRMAKIALDQIQDVDIIELDPQTARKEKRSSAVYLYFTTNEKENPYAQYYGKVIPANTLLAITDGQNEWMNVEWARSYGGDSGRTLSKTKRDDSAGIQKGSANSDWGTGISSLTKVAELADRAYVLDLDILRARYSTEAKRNEREQARKGAIAFKSDKDFKKENMNRYHEILANRAAQMPVDEEVKKAIDMVADQIKNGIDKNQKSEYGEPIIGLDPKGRKVTISDASNVMSNLLNDFRRYVDYTNNAEKEKNAGYDGSYYQREVANYAKSIKDRINKIKNLDYAW